MKDLTKILKFTIFSIIFVSILGTLFHFTFKWSDNNIFVGIFSAVNESTWEHLKLLFYPMLITTIIGYFYLGKKVPTFFCARAYGIITSLLFTTIFFYTYTGILGTNIAILNIASFFISVILGEYISYRLLLTNFNCNNLKSITLLGVLLFCFIFFTFFPPRIGLFEDPITNEYGIINKL